MQFIIYKKMKTTIRNLFTVLLFTLLLNCSTSSYGIQNEILREAEDTPELFFPSDGLTLDQNSCKNPMIDFRDGTQITLASAFNGIGNYHVPEGKYGVRKGELLRLDCSNGKVLGIVKE